MPFLVLFDIDGTLLKMKAGCSKQLFSKIFFELFNKELDNDLLPNFAGKSDLKILREICETHDLSFTELQSNISLVWQKLEIAFTEFCTTEYLILLPGVAKLIEEIDSLPDFQLGLLTGNFESNAYLKLKTFRLDRYFPFGAFGSDHEERNMLPPIALTRANLHSKENIYTNKNTVIIGDSPLDIECAKQNNIPVLCVATGGFPYDKLLKYHPDYILNDFRDTELTINTIKQIFKSH
jgi:phosphoglycolate phosphatase